MRRTIAAVVLAPFLLGCGTPVPSGEPTQLLTGAMPFDEDECLDFVPFQLIVDRTYGTAVARGSGSSVDSYPVMWRPGYTAIRDGDRVVVVDPDGNFVAATGASYQLAGRLLFRVTEGDASSFRRGTVLSSIGWDMFYACGSVHPSPTIGPPGCGISLLVCTPSPKSS